MILSNQVKCNKCGDTPYSSHRHDFRYCSCGSIAVDGGTYYLRRVGDFSKENTTEMSIEWPDDLVHHLEEAVKWADDNGRNEFGVVCAIARYMRDCGYEITSTREST